MLGLCSSANCWVSVRWPFARTSTLFEDNPRITGLPIPAPVVHADTPGILSIVSPRLAV